MLLDLLRTPSSFEGDPRGFLINQLGHMFIFGYMPVHYFGYWGILAIPLYIIIVEATQVLLFDGEIWDGLEDSAYVSLGALVWFTFLALVPLALFLLSGVYRRWD